MKMQFIAFSSLQIQVDSTLVYTSGLAEITRSLTRPRLGNLRSASQLGS